MSYSARIAVLRLLPVAAISLFAFSCKQYEYVSPLPGVLEVRLKVLNTRTQLMPFGPTSSYQLLLKDLVVAKGNITQPIYADLYAFRRNPDGDAFNALDVRARDSSLILGQAYVPPTTFLGLELTVVCGPAVTIFRNQIPIPNTIYVNSPPLPAPPTPTFFRLPESPASREIPIRESGRTVVTVTFDMDSSLVRRSEDFEIHPYFFISSVVQQ